MINNREKCWNKDDENDYFTKPFHIEELIERANIQLRRCKQNATGCKL